MPGPLLFTHAFAYDDLDHPLLLLDRIRSYSYEVDIIGNVRRLRSSCNFNPGSGGCTGAGGDAGGYEYSAFGRTTILSLDAATQILLEDTNPLRWQGRWLHDVAGGVYDFRNRIWSPQIGAFLSADRFEFFSSTGTLWSWPGQNPIAIGDPFGLGARDDLQSALSDLSDVPVVGFFFAGPNRFGRGVQNRVEGTLKLANAATVEAGLRQRARGTCQIVLGAAETTEAAAALVGLAEVSVGLAAAAALSRVAVRSSRGGTVTLYHGSRNFQGAQFDLARATAGKRPFTSRPGIYLTDDFTRAATQFGREGVVVRTNVSSDFAARIRQTGGPPAHLTEYFVNAADDVAVLNRSVTVTPTREAILLYFRGLF